MSERHSKMAPSGDLAQSARQGGVEIRQRLARQAEGKIAARPDVDHALVPAVGFFDRLMHRQRIDEFVGDDDDGTGRDIRQRRMPQHRHVNVLQPLLLQELQQRAHFDQMHDDGGIKILDDLRRPQSIAHQGPASGPELDDAHVFRRAHLLPHRGHPQSDQLAEHLADLGRGDEIAAGAEADRA